MQAVSFLAHPPSSVLTPLSDFPEDLPSDAVPPPPSPQEMVTHPPPSHDVRQLPPVSSSAVHTETVRTILIDPQQEIISPSRPSTSYSLLDPETSNSTDPTHLTPAVDVEVHVVAESMDAVHEQPGQNLSPTQFALVPLPHTDPDAPPPPPSPVPALIELLAAPQRAPNPETDGEHVATRIRAPAAHPLNHDPPLHPARSPSDNSAASTSSKVDNKRFLLPLQHVYDDEEDDIAQELEPVSTDSTSDDSGDDDVSNWDVEEGALRLDKGKAKAEDVDDGGDGNDTESRGGEGHVKGTKSKRGILPKEAVEKCYQMNTTIKAWAEDMKKEYGHEPRVYINTAGIGVRTAHELSPWNLYQQYQRRRMGTGYLRTLLHNFN